MFRMKALLALAAAFLMAAVAGRAQPTVNSTWNNYLGTGTLWSTAGNWLPSGVPSYSTDLVLGFTSSSLQIAGGYTSTFAGGTLNVNAFVLTSQAASNPSAIIQGNAAADTLQFNTSSGAVLPSIWQMGTGRFVFQNGTSTAGITLFNGTTLELRGSGVGEVQLNSTIVQTGAGNSGISINQTGTRAFNTGALMRLGGNNTYAGGVTLTNGNLVIANAGALGGGALTINAPTGGSSNSVQFDPAATATFTIANNITLNSNLNLTGTSTAGTIPNPIAIFSGVLSGNGGINLSTTSATLNYTLTGANTFTGAVNVSPVGNAVAVLNFGTATVGTGSATSASGFRAFGNSSITFENATTVATRAGATATMTLDRANFNVRGNATANTTESMGALTINGTSSVSILGASASAQTTSVTFASLNRGAFGTGTLSVTGTNLNSGSGAGESILIITSDPGGSIGGGGGTGTTNRSILPYMFANNAASTTTTTANSSNQLVRWDNSTGRIVPLAANEYASNLFFNGNSNPTNNQSMASTTALPNAFGVAGLNNSATANSLVLDTNTTATNRVGVSVSGTGTLRVTSGAILSALNGSTGTLPINPSMINTAGLAFGSNPGYVHTVANLTINSSITGSGGFVKSGFGSLFLSGNNTFTGGLTSNSGNLIFDSDSNLGAAGQGFTLNSGLTGAFTYVPNILFGASTGNSVNINRPVTVGPGGSNITVTYASSELVMSGAFTSASGTQFIKAGAGTLTLTGNNSAYNGNIGAVGGTIRFSNDAALGSSTAGLIFGGGNLQPDGTFATNRNALLTTTTLVQTNAGTTWTFEGNITSQTATPAFIKEGPGTMIATGTNTMLGAVQVGTSTVAVRGPNPAATTSAGRLTLSGPDGAFPLASSFNMIGGGELVLDNTTAVNNNRIGSISVSTAGGSVVLRGNASANVTEHVGLLSVSGSTSAPYGGIFTVEQPASAGGQTTSLVGTSLSANTTLGTYFVRGTNLGAVSGDRGQFIINATTAPALLNGMLQTFVGATTATGEPSTFMTTLSLGSNQHSIVPFTAYTAGTGSLGAGAAANTYDVTGAATFAGTSAANALRINAGGSVDLGGGTMTLSASSVLSANGANSGISNGTLNFGTATTSVARITVATGADLNINAVIAGSGSTGLIKKGGGVLTISQPSTLTGTGTTVGTIGIGDGTIRYGVNNALATTNNVSINSGATLDLNNFNATLAGIAGIGNINLGTGTLTLNSSNSPSVSYGGAFSGSGQIIKQGTNTITLAGNSTNTGNVTVAIGTLALNSNTAIGTAPVQLGDTSGSAVATLTLGATVTNFSNPITIPAGATNASPHVLTIPLGITTISSNITMNHPGVAYTSGGITISNAALQYGSGGSGQGGSLSTHTGTITGAAGIVVFSGNHVFAGNNTYSGGTMLDTTTGSSLGIATDSTGSTGPLGTGPLFFSTGFGINMRAIGGARSISNEVRLSSTGGYFGTSGSNPLTFSGNVDLQGATGVQTFNIMNTAMTTFSGTLQNGTGGITKNGPGVLRMTGNNTYTGTTTVNAGTLLVSNASGVGIGGVVTVNSGAILGGSGTIGGAVTVNTGGTIAAGNSVGTLTLNNGLTFNTNSHFGIFINDGTTAGAISTGASTIGTVPNPTSNNFINITAGGSTGLATEALFRIDLNNIGFTNWSQPHSYIVGRGFGDQSTLNVTATSRFNFFNLSPGVLNIDSTSLTGDASGNVYLNFTPTPEPMTTLAFGALAIGGIQLLRRRRRV